jgi:hypothetical protein
MRSVPCVVNCRGDGNQVLALIGSDIQEGLAGFGDTLPDALRELANEIEKEVGYDSSDSKLEWLLTELTPAYIDRRVLTQDECDRIFSIMNAV